MSLCYNFDLPMQYTYHRTPAMQPIFTEITLSLKSSSIPLPESTSTQPTRFHAVDASTEPLACFNNASSCLFSSFSLAFLNMSAVLLFFCSSNSLISASSSAVALTFVAFVNSSSCFRISDSWRSFMLMTSFLPAKSAAVASVAAVVVGVDVDVEGSSKKMVKVAGSSLFLVRETVIETAGLWYLRLGRYIRQNLRPEKCPRPFLYAKSRWSFFTDGGKVAAAGPSLISKSFMVGKMLE